MADHRFFLPAGAFSQRKPSESIGSLMGVTVPIHVLSIDVWDCAGKIVWHTRNGKRHEMEWPADGDVMPIIVAMRMSC
jgi:hypothetical protein